jgi:hypothetical protein
VEERGDTFVSARHVSVVVHFPPSAARSCGWCWALDDVLVEFLHFVEQVRVRRWIVTVMG